MRQTPSGRQESIAYWEKIKIFDVLAEIENSKAENSLLKVWIYQYLQNVIRESKGVSMSGLDLVSDQESIKEVHA